MGERAMRPFWIHQLVEYLIGIALIAQGLQDTEPVVPAVIGALLIVNAAFVRGPFGAFKSIGRATHRWLDVAVAIVAVAAATQPWVPVSSAGRLTVVVVMLAFAFLWWYTDWAERPARADRRTARGGQSSEAVGRTAGRLAGRSYTAIRKAVKRP